MKSLEHAYCPLPSALNRVFDSVMYSEIKKTALSQQERVKERKMEGKVFLYS